MPQKAGRACRHPGCPALAHGESGYCEEHERLHRAEYDRQRGTAAQRGYGSRWRRLRAMYLRRHPLCTDPYQIHGNEVVAATQVDHIVPRKQGGTDQWDNLQGLCASCHSRKTAQEDGRWG